MELDLVFGLGETERDRFDFVYFASTINFKHCVFISPSHSDAPSSVPHHWRTIKISASALFGDVVADRRVVLIHGDLATPELQDGFGWRPLGTIGMRCLELNIALEYHNREDKRISPISDSIGQFIYILDDDGNKVMTNDSHIPCLTLPKVRRSPLGLAFAYKWFGSFVGACLDTCFRRYGVLVSK